MCVMLPLPDAYAEMMQLERATCLIWTCPLHHARVQDFGEGAHVPSSPVMYALRFCSYSLGAHCGTCKYSAYIPIVFPPSRPLVTMVAQYTCQYPAVRQVDPNNHHQKLYSLNHSTCMHMAEYGRGTYVTWVFA
jgi:hypothetical protein